MFDAEFIFTLILHLFSFWFFIYSILQCIITEFVSIKTFRWVFLSSFSPESPYFFHFQQVKTWMQFQHVFLSILCVYPGVSLINIPNLKHRQLFRKVICCLFNTNSSILNHVKVFPPKKKKEKKRGLSFKNNT